MSRVVTLTINDKEVSGLDEETIMQVAMDNGIEIPRLCYIEGLSIAGACRLCMVASQRAWLSKQIASACRIIGT
jgi:NADH dehydrogenase/NADH:ubiquinone oxidoreductase subunit G